MMDIEKLREEFEKSSVFSNRMRNKRLRFSNTGEYINDFEESAWIGFQAHAALQSKTTASAIHYPECWDVAAYQTVASALDAVYAAFACSAHSALKDSQSMNNLSTIGNAIDVVLSTLQEAKPKSTMALPNRVKSIMEQAQVFASAWSLLGSGSAFESDDQLEIADDEKEKLRKMIMEIAGPEASRREIFGICDAYESGIGHGLQNDGHSSGEIFGDTECGEAYEIGYKEGFKRTCKTKLEAAAVQMSDEEIARIYQATFNGYSYRAREAPKVPHMVIAFAHAILAANGEVKS